MKSSKTVQIPSIEVSLVEVQEGVWDAQIGNGYYAWNCSKEKAIKQVQKRLVDIYNKLIKLKVK